MSVSVCPDEVKRQQESLQRCQSLEEVQRLFDAGAFAQVVDALTATFTSAPRHALKVGHGECSCICLFCGSS